MPVIVDAWQSKQLFSICLCRSVCLSKRKMAQATKVGREIVHSWSSEYVNTEIEKSKYKAKGYHMQARRAWRASACQYSCTFFSSLICGRVDNGVSFST